jgi:hypothetical protein
MNEPSVRQAEFGPFLPVLILSAALAVLLGWQLTRAVRQYINALQIGERQTVLASQAADTERRLQAIMMDLLDLADKDASASAIVERYGIRFTPPPTGPAPTPPPRAPVRPPTNAPAALAPTPAPAAPAAP